MTATIKKDASQDFIESVRQIEENSDECFRTLRLLTMPSNVAIWSLLVGGINMIEKEIAARGDNTLHLDAVLLNVSRFAPIAMKWAVEHGRPASRLATKRWTAAVAAAVEEALFTAHHYSSFLTCLPMWHKDRYAAELLSPAIVRFTAVGSGRHRQVSAYQKGFRPIVGAWRGERAPKLEQTPKVQELFSRVFEDSRKTGMLRFEYSDPWDLWLALLPEYRARVTGITRRATSISLGEYTLEEFTQFYAALLAICAAHEFLCFAWAKNHTLYPFDSAVMVWSSHKWVDRLSRLGGISPTKCDSMIRDLTFDFSRSLDFHVHPFVPLSSGNRTLAIAPQFPLHSRPDENILRVCSIVKPDVFDAASLGKESESLAHLKQQCRRHYLQGPVGLPRPLPDIDLLVSDEASSTLLIAELKWIRKTVRPVEIMARDADVRKGVRQLKQIRDFLLEKPDYLYEKGTLPRRLSEYANTHYLLVARDHWLWIEPEDGIASAEYEALAAALSRHVNLHLAVTDLLRYEWLPLEGRDFTVKYDRSTAKGVSIECEVFYPA
jgi:hypothetical protein